MLEFALYFRKRGKFVEDKPFDCFPEQYQSSADFVQAVASGIAEFYYWETMVIGELHSAMPYVEAKIWPRVDRVRQAMDAGLDQWPNKGDGYKFDLVALWCAVVGSLHLEEFDSE